MSLVDTFVEVHLINDEDFLKVKETLSRIGIASRKEKVLYPSCLILHKRGKFYITHFKEMLALDGKDTNITEEDLGRRNTIACLLEQWGLVKIVSENADYPKVSVGQIKIIPYKDKNQWIICNKYTIGNK